jgi:hypothetical protein
MFERVPVPLHLFATGSRRVNYTNVKKSKIYLAHFRSITLIERHCNTCVFLTRLKKIKDNVVIVWIFLPVEQCWYPAVPPGSTCSQQTGDIFLSRCHNPESPPEI